MGLVLQYLTNGESRPHRVETVELKLHFLFVVRLDMKNVKNSNAILKQTIMTKLSDNNIDTDKVQIDDKEALCGKILATLTQIIDDRDTTKDKRLIVWLECEQRIIFDQYDNEDYRKFVLSSLAQKGFEFKQVEFEKGKSAENNHNVFKIEGNSHECLEVGDYEVVQQPFFSKKAKLFILEGLCEVNPLQKEYVLSSEEITSGRIRAYNIGRGQFVQNNGVFRENHIIFDDNPDLPLRKHYLCVGRSHAHIGFDSEKGFFFQVDEDGACHGKTVLMNGGKAKYCDCSNSVFPLKSGDMIIIKDGRFLKAMLFYKELKN